MVGVWTSWKRILLSVVFEEGNFSFAGEVYNSYRMWVEVLELGYIAW